MLQESNRVEFKSTLNEKLETMWCWRDGWGKRDRAEHSAF